MPARRTDLPDELLVDLLDRAAADAPTSGIRFVDGPTLSWPALRDASLRAAGGAHEAGVRPGAPVLLLIADPAVFFPLFWGVVRLGAIAVPLAPPRDASPDEIARVARVQSLLGGAVVSDLPLPGVAAAAEWLAGPPRDDRGPGDAPPLLQFSSGSTRDPRGVVLSHANLRANVAQLAAALPLTRDDIDLAWMPHFHDMGLIGCHLLPLSLGMRQVRMRPEAAMGDPLVWLRVAAATGATTLSATNFALARANRRLRATGERPDLARVRWVFNGAEPIDAEVCRAFSRLTGVSERVHVPLYGLAEASVGVSAAVDGLRTVFVGGHERVDLGPPLPGVSVRVVGPDDVPLPGGAAGAVQVSGPNVTAGYWRDPDATATLRCADWIRTGDVGALVGGRLVLVGRDKDVLVVNGRNLAAHDVEALAEAVPGVRAAVAVADGRAAAERVTVGIVAPEGTAPVLAAVRRTLAVALGVEVVAVPLPRVVRTTSGKKRRVAFRAAVEAGTLDDALGDTRAVVRRMWEEALRRPLRDDELDTGFRVLGGGSLAAVELLANVAARYGHAPDHHTLLAADSVSRLARWLERTDPPDGVHPGDAGCAGPLPTPAAGPAAPPAARGRAVAPIAIIASACRLPGAPDPAAFAALVASGASVIRPGRVGVGGWLDAIDTFDAVRFGIAADEAAAMDPQQRLFLTVAAEALERAGIGGGGGGTEGAGIGGDRDGEPTIGVYVGAGQQAYLETVLAQLHEPLPAGTLAGNLLSMLAARVAHRLDLRGPALTVDTACSASLVAVHLACQALRAGECDVAVAGGVNLNLTPTVHRLFAVAGALSPTGRCRPFAADADGMVPGEGAGVVVLAPLGWARAHGHRVLGVVCGSAVNNDGVSLGVMAPNPAGQERVIRAALAAADVPAAAIRFVEAHATGTAVGDAVERGVLGRAYPHAPRIGAVKGQVGHLLGAAGITGLLRALGELGAGELGAVSSFGFGGTNAHVVVAGGPDREDRPVTPGAPRSHWLGDGDATGWVHVVTRDDAGRLAWATPPDGPERLREGGRYVITGATGGIGRALAIWLARRWRARLALLGHRRDAADLVEAVRRAGGDAFALTGDLGADGPALLAEAVRRLGDIAPVPRGAAAARVDGLFHLAGGLDAGALAAKIAGAAALDTVDVGFVALFASVAGVLPGLDAGLEAYAAANATLDRMARARPGWVSIAWPPWEGVGMAASFAGAFRAGGIAPIAPPRAFAALRMALAAGAPNVVVLDRPALVAGAAPADLREQVRRLVAEAAHVPVATLRDDDRVARLGVDSIQAVELVKDLERLVGRPLPNTLLYEHDTVDAIVGTLGGGGGTAPVTPAPTAAPPPPEATPPEAAPTGPAVRPPATAPSPRPGPRLLPSQQTFLVQQAYFPAIPGNVLLGCTVTPAIAPDHLAAALDRVTRRHPMLRAVLVRDGSGWREAEGPPPALVWGPFDRDAVHAATFDLARGPLVRVFSDGAALVLDAHHGVADAWSLQVVLLDLLAAADALGRGAEPAWPPLRAGWTEASSALRDVGGGDPSWWNDRYRDGVPPLPLPWDGAPDAPAHGPGVVRVVLSAADTAALTARARVAAVTLPALVLASYVERLWRWSGQHDVVVRVAHGRREVRVPDVARIVGPFADSLPARVEVHPGEPLPALAARVTAELAAVAAQAGASAIALAGLGTRAGGPTGITPAGFSFPLLPAPARVGEHAISDVHGASASGFTRLGLIAWVFDGRLHASWNHLESHLSADRVRRWAAEHAATLVAFARGEAAAEAEAAADAVAADAVVSCTTLGVGTRGSVPGVGTQDRLHLRILAAARRHPARIAVDADTGTLSYRALDRRSGALAEQIVARIAARPDAGTPVDTPLVAVLAPPGADAVVAILATLRAGAAWVGLDPSWPDARIRDVLGIARPVTLLTPPELSDRAGVFAVDVVPIGSDESVDGPCRPGTLAHVMFTSGSTGRPKGVAVAHDAVLAFLDWVEAVLGVTAADRFVQTSSLAFGGCIRQIFAPLCAGATIVPAPHAALRDPDALLTLLEQKRVTIFNAVPSVWMHLLDAAERRAGPDGRALPDVRWVLVGGEAVPAAFTRRWRARFGRSHRLANLYGSTETVVNATWHEVVDDADAGDTLTPIGRARAGLRVALVEPGGEAAVAPGQVGEIVVAGAIAEGYLRDPDLTARVFVTLAGLGRAYRTGDLARRRPDGSLVHVGRADSQVQVRGNRVELGEVEAVLAGHPAVAHAAVVFADGHLHAIAELRPDAAPPSDSSVLRGWLAERLPAWMVPARVVVSAVPRTAAGKIDRAAVLAGFAVPGASEAAAPGGGALPRNAPPGGAPPPLDPRGGVAAARGVALEGAAPTVPERDRGGTAAESSGSLGAARVRTDGALGPGAAVGSVVTDGGWSAEESGAGATHVGAHPAAAAAARLGEVAAAWQWVLRLPVAPTAEADFFALGGDSIDVLDVIARLRERGLRPPAPLVFYRARTLGAVATLCGMDPEGPAGGVPAVAAPPDAAAGASAPLVAAARPGPLAAADRAGLPPDAPTWPLSPVQRGFWLAHQAGTAPAWTAAVPLAGPLDLDAFGRAVAAVIERHPLLRAVVTAGPAQTIRATRAVVVPFEDLGALPADARAAVLATRWAELRAARWDLAEGPLFRMRLCRVGPDRHEWILTAHHLVADAWSAWLVAGEVLLLHDAFRDGRPPALPAPAGTFAREVARGLAEPPDPWWDTSLDGLAQRPAPAGATGCEARVTLDAETWRRLRRYARRRARSPFVVVLAAFAEALQQVATSPDLLVSIALAGRDDPAMARVVGPFATGLPVRIGGRVDEDRVAAALDAALAHPSVAGVVTAGGGLARLGRYFLTWLDPAVIPGGAAVGRGAGAGPEVADAKATGAGAAGDARGPAVVAGEGGAVPPRGRGPDPVATAGLPGAPALHADWSAGRYHFDAGATGTEVLAAALVGDGLRIDLAGGACVGAVATALESRLRERCRADAALVVYLPDDVAGAAAPGSPLASRADGDGAGAIPLAPLRIETVEAGLGVSELVLLPISASRLADADLAAALAAAVACTDARVVALAGVLPALTGLGLRPLWEGGPLPTTGHAATVVAMLLTVEEALLRTGRRWSTLTVGFCGLGAIGRAVAALTTAVLGPPRRVLRSDPRLPGADDDLHDADWILAATSGGVALDVSALRPGTVVIDDSFPRAFDDRAGRARMEGARDVLLVGGGMLDAGPLDRRSPFPGADALRARFGARWLPGCHAEALLVAADPALGPTVGPVDLPRAHAMLAAVRRAGLRAAPLHLGSWEIPAAVIAGVRAAAGGDS